MRLGNMPEGELASKMSAIDSEIKDAYLTHMTKLVSGVPVKVMLGDTAVMDQTTFDTKAITSYMERITSGLDTEIWFARSVAETRDDDIRRIFVKFESESGGYRVSVHLSVQFKALLYYEPNARVVQIQKELAEIDSEANENRDEIARRGDRIIAEYLESTGHGDLDHAKLFEMLYGDESLAEHVSDLVKKSADDSGLATLVDKRSGLFDELDSLLMEVYSTTAIMIDDARLVTGEDGFLYTVDIDRMVAEGRKGHGNGSVSRKTGNEADAVHDTAASKTDDSQEPSGRTGISDNRVKLHQEPPGHAAAWEGSFDAGEIPRESEEFLVSRLEGLLRAVRSAGRDVLKESE